MYSTFHIPRLKRKSRLLTTKCHSSTIRTRTTVKKPNACLQVWIIFSHSIKVRVIGHRREVFSLWTKLYSVTICFAQLADCAVRLCGAVCFVMTAPPTPPTPPIRDDLCVTRDYQWKVSCSVKNSRKNPEFLNKWVYSSIIPRVFLFISQEYSAISVLILRISEKISWNPPKNFWTYWFHPENLVPHPGPGLSPFSGTCLLNNCVHDWFKP